MSATLAPLILASTSRYRRALLERLGLPFVVSAPGVDETPQPNEPALNLAERLALAKARAVAEHQPEAIVIGSDQVAVCGERLLGKPGTLARASEQLQAMAGQEVFFYTALAVVQGTRHRVTHVTTRCQLRQLTARQIEHYLRAELPLDTAGSAKAEGLGIALMEAIHSDDPTALIGLPLIALCRLLREFGVDPLEHALPLEAAR